MYKIPVQISRFLSKKRNVLVAVIALFVLVAIPLTYKLSQQEQDIRQEAAVRQPALLGKTYEESVRDKNIPAVSSVLEVSVNYQVSGDPPLSVTGARVAQGYVPKVLVTNPEYSVQVQDLRGVVLSTTPFVVPDDLVSPPPLDGQSAKSEVVLSNVNFAVTVPYSDQASRVVIVDSGGQVVATASLANVQKANNKPSFRSVRGDVFLQQGGRELNFKTVPEASAYSNNDTLDIAFVGDDYMSNDAFQNDAVKFASKLLEFEPFKSRASQINFYYVDNASDLGCKYDTTITRLIACDYQKVSQAVNNAGVPYDKIAVIFNSPTYGGSAGSALISVAYNGYNGPSVFVHEFGHSFGELIDEYTNGQSNPLSNTTLSNCYAGTPPSEAWKGVVAENSYFQGCKFDNWYRSSQDSIMRHIATPYFNEISKNILNKQLDVVTRSVLPPTPSPTSVSGAGLPVGYLDVVSCTNIQGWTCDPDNFGKSLNVHIYTGGPYGSGGTYVGKTVASIERSDVASLCGGTSAHGYFFTVPASLKNATVRSIYVHAINVDSKGVEGGKNPVLSNSGKTITCGTTSAPSTVPSKPPASSPTLSPTSTKTKVTPTPTYTQKVTPTSVQNFDPKGNFESASCTKFVGWACDPNKYTAPLKVHFYRDAPYGAKGSVYVGQTVAGLKRTDVASVCGNTSAHGWSYTLPGSLKDGKDHTVYAYPINILSTGAQGGKNPYVYGSPKSISCK